MTDRLELYTSLLVFFSCYVIQKQISDLEDEWNRLKEKRDKAIENKENNDILRINLVASYSNKMENILKQIVLIEEYYNV